jgi:Domain of unknown function (DUF6702)
MMLNSFLYTVIFSLGLTFHPFHISVCDIEHNSETKSLEISQRIFMDDLEVGLKNFHKIEYVDAFKPEDPAELDSLINEYLQANLEFIIDGVKTPFTFLGSEMEGDARWCYLEAKNVVTVKSVQITNKVLIQSLEDQENIVHFKANDKLKSYRLNKDEKQTTLNW